MMLTAGIEAADGKSYFDDTGTPWPDVAGSGGGAAAATAPLLSFPEAVRAPEDQFAA